MFTYLSFALIWSLGANIHDNTRGTFGEEIRFLLKKKFSEFPDGDVFEHGLDVENHRLEPWTNQLPSFTYRSDMSFFDILVPTSDTVKYKFLL